MESSYFLPSGPTQTKWYQYGYQAALRDLSQVLARGGSQAALDWINANIEGVNANIDHN